MTGPSIHPSNDKNRRRWFPTTQSYKYFTPHPSKKKSTTAILWMEEFDLLWTYRYDKMTGSYRLPPDIHTSDSLPKLWPRKTAIFGRFWGCGPKIRFKWRSKADTCTMLWTRYSTKSEIDNVSRGIHHNEKPYVTVSLDRECDRRSWEAWRHILLLLHVRRLSTIPRSHGIKISR